MSKEEVIVTIDKETGNMTVEGKGFVGTGCNVLKDIERQLGTVTATKNKPEMYQQIQPDFVPINV